uniref:Uncharacterized protein n=1 Tax=Meloidogyne enterolobii TaxID=390850 RepID=A0A6V7TQR6_MELEN|nr:unnamed protein product [Meloidogyne enterolobii]
MKLIGSDDVQKNGENNVQETSTITSNLMGIGHSTTAANHSNETNSTNLKNETKNDFEKQNLIKNNNNNNNISRPTNLLLLPTSPPPPPSSSLKSLITPSSLLPPPPLNNQSKSLPSSLLPSPSLNPSIPPPFSSSLNSESSPSSNMAAATFLSNWRRQSKTTKNNNKTINCVNENNENNNKINNGYTLSELSHDVLAQIIRLFPFSSSLTPTPSSSSSSTSTIINNNSSSSPSQRHIIYRALSQPNPTINTNLKCSSLLNEEKKKKEENKSLININKLNNNNEDEEILNNNNKIPPKKQLLRDWHTRAGSSSLGRKLRRAASTFSGSKMIEGISSKERPKNLSIFGKSEKNSRKNGKSPPTSCNGALSRLCKVGWQKKLFFEFKF